MRTISKKILSLLLVAVLVMSAVPFAAFADEHTCGEDVIEMYTGIWECSCGKIYRTADCSDAPMTDAEFAAWLDEHSNSNAPAPQSASDTKAINYVLRLEQVDGTYVNSNTYTRNPKITESIGNAPSLNSFTVPGGADLNDYKTNVVIWTDSPDGDGKAYDSTKSVANLTDNETYYARLSLQRINVTVQATWTDGTAKSYTLSNREYKLKELKNTDIIDYLKDNFQSTVNAAVTDKHFGSGADASDEFSNYGWDGFWYEGGTKITDQKFTSKGLNTTYTFTAKLTKNSKSTVTFDPNQGTCSVNSKVLNTGSAYGTLPVPTRSGMVFVGWFNAMPATDDLQYDSNGHVKVTAPVKQYFNNTPVNEDVTLYAWWAQQADITLYVFNNNAPGATPVDTGKILGVPVGATLLKSHITSALTGTTDLAGPFNYDKGAEDKANTSNWSHYTNYRNGVNVLGKKVGESEKLAVFVNPGRLKDNQNVGINYNANSTSGGSTNSGTGSSSGSSSAASDPSNPKTGDAQRTMLNVAAVSLAVATVALGMMTTVMFVRRKNEA